MAEPASGPSNLRPWLPPHPARSRSPRRPALWALPGCHHQDRRSAQPSACPRPTFSLTSPPRP
eukprot:11012322-Lingulodinium_polyedra.AAC.1